MPEQFSRDFILKREYIVERSVVAIRLQMSSGYRIDQLRVDANPDADSYLRAYVISQLSDERRDLSVVNAVIVTITAAISASNLGPGNGIVAGVQENQRQVALYSSSIGIRAIQQRPAHTRVIGLRYIHGTRCMPGVLRIATQQRQWSSPLQEIRFVGISIRNSPDYRPTGHLGLADVCAPCRSPALDIDQLRFCRRH